MKVMPHRISGGLLGWALALNAFWEWAQCAFFYDMGRLSLWKSALWMLAATIADGFMVLAVAKLAAMLVGRNPVTAPDGKSWTALLGVGLIAGVGVEWAARGLNLWEYGPLMPTVQLLGTTIGLVPLAQMALLPSLSVWLTTRRKMDRAG